MLFRVLGPLDFVRSGGEQVAIQQQKQRTVLSGLLLYANRWIAADRLIDMIWNDTPPRSAAGNLKTYIWKLRGLLAEGSAANRIVSGQGGYRIMVARDELDTYLFEDLLVAGRQVLHAGQFDRASAMLSSALGLWRGEQFGDLETTATEAALVQLGEQRLAAMRDLAIARIALAQHSEVVPSLRELVAQHPLQERPRALLMLALYRAGRPAEALAVYQDSQEVLDRELGLQPGTELARLHHGILNQDPWLTGTDVLSVFMGAVPTAHVLAKDQLPQFESAAQPAVTPFQLPGAIASFVGRDSGLAQLDEVLPGQAGKAAIAIIAGPPGIGKSALALHWGHRSRLRFPDGVLYLDMRGHAADQPVRPRDALPQLLRSLGVSPERVPTDLSEQTSLYRSLLDGQRVLIVLDDVSSPAQVRPLLPSSPACAVLITSRNRLSSLFAMQDAYYLSLDVLSETESHDLLTTLLGDQRVAADQAAAHDLARLCGHLPLALRIAAGNLAGRPHRSLADFVRALGRGDRISALAIPGDQDAALKSAFDSSYSALPAQAGMLFRRLGLLPCPLLTDLLAAVVLDVPVDDAAGLLDLLRGGHLLDQHPSGEHRFHDLLRLYAHNRAVAEETSSERAEVLDRVLEFYLQAAEAAAAYVAPGVDRLTGPAISDGVPLPDITDATQATEWLKREQPNLSAMIRYAAEHDLAPYPWLLVDAQRGYFWVQRYGPYWLTDAEAGLEAARRAGDAAGQAVMHRMIGLVHSSVGEPDKAVGQQVQALALFRSAGNTYGVASTLTNLGIALWELGDLHSALEHFQQSMQGFQELGNTYGIAAGHTNIGRVYHHLGMLDAALAEHRRARQLFGELNSHYGVAAALNGIGAVHLAKGEPDEAIAAHDEVRLLEAHAGTYERVGALIGLANANRDKGLAVDAMAYAEQALGLAADAGLRALEGAALVCLAEIHLATTRYDQCEDHAQHAATLLRAAHSRAGHVSALRVLGEARLHTQGVDLAASTWLKALALCTPFERESHTLGDLLSRHGIFTPAT